MIVKLVRPVVIALALSFATAAVAEPFSSLEERMSAAEFKRAGLDKLSPEELANLNEWLRGKSGPQATGNAVAASVEDRRGFLSSGASEGAVVSRILGEFRGWQGKGDQFRLENGQVWEVVDSSSKLVVKMQDPTVTITEGFLAGWRLKVSGYNAVAKVKRIK